MINKWFMKSEGEYYKVGHIVHIEDGCFALCEMDVDVDNVPPFMILYSLIELCDEDTFFFNTHDELNDWLDAPAPGDESSSKLKVVNFKKGKE